MDKRNKKIEQRKGIFEADIGNDEGYSQVEDAVMKTVMQCFKDELLPYFGIKKKAIAIAPTEAVTSYQYKVSITTYVLFSGKIKNPMTEFMEGVNTYKVQPIIMTKFNVDELVRKLQGKVEAGKKLLKADLVPLTICPLMGGDMSQKDRIKKTLEFLKKAEKNLPKNEVEKIESVVYAMAEKFLENVEMDEIREMMKMTRLGQMLRAEEKYQSLISKILRKIQKNCTVSEMADMLEEDEEVVQKIYDIAVAQGSKYDVEQIYREFMQQKEARD